MSDELTLYMEMFHVYLRAYSPEHKVTAQETFLAYCQYIVFVHKMC